MSRPKLGMTTLCSGLIAEQRLRQRAVKARLLEPPPDGGLWTSPKVAAWMAGELGLAEVLPQRGWEALKAIGWSVQKPRPRHPASATPEEREAFKKSWSRPSPRSGRSTRASRSRSGPPTSAALA